MGEFVPAELLAQSMANSKSFAMDSRSYAGFSLTRNRRLIVGCIEPRDPDNAEPGEYKVIMQTPGGFLGEGLDHALASYAYDGTEMDVPEGMRQDSGLRISKSLDAHADCAFHGSLAAVTGEMAYPEHFTRDSVLEWAGLFGEREGVESNLGRISTAAEIQLGLLEKTPADDLLALADSLQPGHPNVYGVKYRPLARTYIMNFHPHLGKNRNMKPADPEQAALIQAYHDSIGAMVCDLTTAFTLPKEMKGLRLASLLLRSAATRTVIASSKSEMTFIDVNAAGNPDGMDVKERVFKNL